MTAVLKDSFSNPFSDFPIERLHVKENPNTDIPALKSVLAFHVRLQIRNPDLDFLIEIHPENPNPNPNPKPNPSPNPYPNLDSFGAFLASPIFQGKNSGKEVSRDKGDDA